MIRIASKFRICKVTSLLTIVIFSLPTPALFQTNDIRFDRLSIDDGLSNSYVTCILQDSKGFMWFGTQDGLNKYDGYNFNIYKHDPSNSNSLSDNYVRSITETKNGILWIGTENGSLIKFDLATTISFDLPEAQQVTVSIYDLNGREVATLTNREYSAGSHSVVWDAGGFGSGVYVYRLSAGSSVAAGKLVLVK